MTLVIAAQGEDFVVVGADSKGTVANRIGERVEMNLVQKLVKVNEHAMILLYGNVERAQYLIDELSVQNRFAPTSGVRHIAREFKSLCRDEARVPIGMQIPEERSYFGFIIAGLEESGGVFRMPKVYGFGNDGYSLGLGRDGFLIKGKPMIAIFNFAREYRSACRDKETLCKLVAQSLHDTIQVDGDVGGAIKLGVIDSAGARIIDDPEVIRDFIDDKWVNR